MSDYLIQSETLEAIGDEVRRLTGTENTMTPNEMATALSGVTVGGGLIPDHDELQFMNLSYDGVGDTTGIFQEGYSSNGSRLWALGGEGIDIIWSMPSSVDSLSETVQNVVSQAGLTLVSLKMPNLSRLAWLTSSYYMLVCAEFPSCTELGDSTQIYGLYEAPQLERVVLNSACAIPGYTFNVDSRSLDSDPTFKLYLKGTTMGTCSANAFGTVNEELFQKMKIYVPPSLLDDFKTTWAEGAFADIIYADPEVSV